MIRWVGVLRPNRGAHRAGSPSTCQTKAAHKVQVLEAREFVSNRRRSEFAYPSEGQQRCGRESETSAHSGARCWRKRSVCEIPFRKIVFELGVPIGSDVFVEKIQQRLDFRRQP